MTTKPESHLVRVLEKGTDALAFEFHIDDEVYQALAKMAADKNISIENHLSQIITESFARETNKHTSLP